MATRFELKNFPYFKPFLLVQPSHFIDPMIPLKPNCYLRHFVQTTTIGSFIVIFRISFPRPTAPSTQRQLLYFFFSAQLEYVLLRCYSAALDLSPWQFTPKHFCWWWGPRFETDESYPGKT